MDLLVMHVQRKMQLKADLCIYKFIVLNSSFMVSSCHLCFDCFNLIDALATTYYFSHMCSVRTQFNKTKPSMNLLMIEGF